MKKSRITAVVAERLFGLAIILLLVCLVVDFIFVTNFLKTEAANTEKLRQKSIAIDSDITKLKAADAWLQKNSEIVERTSAIVAESKLYQYQNQIINDFNAYGNQTGIPISGYTFSATETTGTASTPAPAPTQGQATPAPSPGPEATATANTPSLNVNSVTVTINITESVKYQSFLNLLRLIEQNVTRMQVNEIALTPDVNDPTMLVNPSLTLKVYTR